MSNDDNLAEVIAGCKKGQAEQFSKLVDIYATRCYGYFYRLTGNRATSNDLLSELFLRLLRKIGSYRAGSFEKWLFTIASNIFYDYLRDKQRERKLVDNLKTRAERNLPTAVTSDGYAIDNLQRQLQNLDAETKELLILRYYSQMSFKEIAELRAVPIGTILSKVHRGLKKLRQLMEDEK